MLGAWASTPAVIRPLFLLQPVIYLPLLLCHLFPIITHHPLSSLHHPLSSLHHPVSSLHHPLTSLHHPLTSLLSSSSCLPLSSPAMQQYTWDPLQLHIHHPLTSLHHPLSSLLSSSSSPLSSSFPRCHTQVLAYDFCFRIRIFVEIWKVVCFVTSCY